MNDINILDSLSIVDKVINGEPSDFEYEVNKKLCNLCYYLVDEKYLNWVMFINSLAEEIYKKEEAFSGAQEVVRKDVQRAFGVLSSKWHLLAKAYNYTGRNAIKCAAKTSIIIHNILVELRRNGYKSELFKDAKVTIENFLFVSGDREEK